MNKQQDNVDDFLSMFNQVEETECIDDFRVTRDDLMALAEHYLTERWNDGFSRRFYPAARLDRSFMLDQRLCAIGEVLGCHTFRGIQERVDEKWRRIVKEARRALVCKACGVPQHTLWEIQSGTCMECRDADGPQAERGEAAHSTLRSPGS